VSDLKVWTDGVQWIVTGSAESAERIAGWHLHEWRAMADKETVTYQMPGAGCVTRTAAELVAEARDGFYLACVETLPHTEAPHADS
jgi:hypothetical protein